MGKKGYALALIISFALFTLIDVSFPIHLTLNARLLDNYISNNPQILNSIVTNNPQLTNSSAFDSVIENIIRKSPDLVSNEIKSLKNETTTLKNQIKTLETKLEYATVIVTGNVAVNLPLPQGVLSREATGIIFRNIEENWEVRASVTDRIYKDLLRNDRSYSVTIEYRDNLENKKCIPKESPIRLAENVKEFKVDLECK